MESIKAISLMVLWTVLSLYALYYLGALKTLEILFNSSNFPFFVRYTYDQYVYLLKVGGNKPYEWKKLN